MSKRPDFHPLSLKQLAEKYGKKPRRSKYGNRRVRFEGMMFDSILERDRFVFLRGEQDKGLIFGLERQVEYALRVDGRLICSVVPDFRYHLKPSGMRVVEDTKGVTTPEWRIKAKLFHAIYGYPIKVVTKKNLTELPWS